MSSEASTIPPAAARDIFRSISGTSPLTTIFPMNGNELMWADAVFFKDPFDDLNAASTLSPRAIDCLILAAWLTGFYDFAIELTQKCVPAAEGRDALVRLAREAARSAASVLMDDYRRERPAYLDVRKFVDRNISNSSTDFFTG